MRGDIFLSPKESRRVYVMEQVVDGKVTIRQAAELLGLGERQVKRLKGRLLKEGVAALAHKNRGRKPAHAVPQHVRDRVIELSQGLYHDASCQQMSELLAEHEGIVLSAKTIRRILSSSSIPIRYTRRSPRGRRCRDRMPQEGLLVQGDASPFHWLEDRGPELALHGFIDDATGKILGLYFRLEEDLHGYLQVLGQMLSNHGIPRSLYTDRHTILISPKKDKLTIQEELAGKVVALTQFGQAIQDLGITHIGARSPQAKGRIERLWRTLQGRLVIELRIAGISTIEDANRFLPGFIQRYNARFAVQPADPTLAFSPAPNPDELRRILSRREPRKASQGSTISYSGCTYQLVNDHGTVVPLRPRSEVIVLKHLDSSLSALYNGKLYSLKKLAHPVAVDQAAPALDSPAPRRTYKPPMDHPWRRPACLPRQTRPAG